ncbi:hypothetical protein BDR07DRAFT_977819 [Suillus spraguei]|nr:hypothetical protein BDR07DRAFT_977819 [Suillus spraguei]
MHAIIQAEGELQVKHPHRPHHRPRRALKKHSSTVTTTTIDDDNFFSSLQVEETSDADDGDFTTELASELSSGSSSDTDTVEVVSNKELATILPTKTVPSHDGRTSTRPNVRHSKKNISKRKSPAIGSSVEEVDDVDDPCPQLSPTHRILKHSKSRALTNPIRLFYEEVSTNSSGVEGNRGDKHYKCYHGQRKILTVTKAMRSSLNGLIGHIKNHFPAMFRLYLHLKLHAEPPTEEEIAIASGKKILDPTKATEYLLKLERSSSNITDAFNDQNQRAAVDAFNDQNQRAAVMLSMTRINEPQYYHPVHAGHDTH